MTANGTGKVSSTGEMACAWEMRTEWSNMIRIRLSFRGHVYLLLLCHYLACWLVLGFSSDACFILPSGIACLCAMYRAALFPPFVLVLLLFLLPYKTHLRRVKGWRRQNWQKVHTRRTQQCLATSGTRVTARPVAVANSSRGRSLDFFFNFNTFWKIILNLTRSIFF